MHDTIIIKIDQSINMTIYLKISYFLPKDARPYRTPVAKAMAFPNKVVKVKLKNTGNRAILDKNQ